MKFYEVYGMKRLDKLYNDDYSIWKEKYEEYKSEEFLKQTTIY